MQARVIVPIAVFAGIVALLAVGLTRDPRLVPSPLIGKPAPDFTLPSLQAPEQRMRLADLKGRVSLLNVWGTWCVACRQEHGMLVEIANSGAVPIYGLNYKDNREDALRWLEQLGNPYIATGFDADGQVAIEFGVYGAPETYVIARDGIVAHKHVGPITPEVWQGELLPIVQQLGGAGR